MVRTDEGSELTIRLSEIIDPAGWGPRHLPANAQLGETLGAKIEVKYVDRSDGKIVTELSE